MCQPTISTSKDDSIRTNGNQQERLVGQPQFMSIESYSLLLLGLASIAYSVMSAYIQLASSTGIPSNELVLIRTTFQGSLVLLAMIWFRGYKDDGTSTRLIWLPYGDRSVRSLVLARGIIGGLGLCLYYYTVSVLPLGDAVTFLSLNPIITVLAGAIFLGESVRPSHIMAAAASLIGCVLISQPSFVFGTSDYSADFHQKYSSVGYVTALLGACTAASVYILMRRAGKVGVHTLQLLFAWVTFGTINSISVGLLFPWLRGEESAFIWPTSATSWYYIMGCCVSGSTGHFFLNYAGRHAPAGMVAIVRSSGIMWSYALEIAVFHQVPHFLTVIGVGLICTSLVMVALEKKRESEAPKAENNGLKSTGPKNYGSTDEEEQRPLTKS